MKNILKILLFSITSLMTIASVSPGDKAPSFTLTNEKGKKVSLEDYKGKTVVLEWFNHGCPFVRKHYDSENMQSSQQVSRSVLKNDVVWLSISSSAKGKQGYLADATAATKMLESEKSKAHHMLLDHDGEVGKAYGAKTTPQIVIIDKKGEVVYNGAIDSIASANQDDIEKAKNYATHAIRAIAANTKVTPSKTKPYGCSVKY